MKSKYMSRKFVVAVIGLGVSVVATVCNNTVVALGGLLLAGSFVIGEAIVDAHACTKKTIDITEYRDIKEKKE